MVASLRRLLPPLVPSYCSDEQLSDLLANEILAKLPLTSLLLTGQPVPQYTIRLLTEIMGASEVAAGLVASLLLYGPVEEQQAVPASMLQLQTLLMQNLMIN